MSAKWKIVPVEADENMLMHHWMDEDGDWAETLRIQAESDWRKTLAQAPRASEDVDLVEHILDTVIWRDASGVATTLREIVIGWTPEHIARAVLRRLEGAQ